MKMCELGSVSNSNNVQSLRRPSILCDSRLVSFFQSQEPFCLKSICNDAGEAVFPCIC